MVQQVCECMDPDCHILIDLPPCVASDIKDRALAIIIVDGCPRGPEPTDKLVEKRCGYSLYEETAGIPF